MSGTECISIHMGKTGIQIGSSCWELYCLEHGIDRNGTLHNNPEQQGRVSPELGEASLSRFFSEKSRGVLRPRAVFVDLGPDTLEETRMGEYSTLFEGEQFVSGGYEDTAGNFARGHFTLGSEYCDAAVDAIKKQVESCDSQPEFLVFSSWGGGAGTGYASLLMDQVKADNTKATIVQFAVMPSPSNSLTSSALEQYNATLAMTYTLDLADHFVLFDNQALEAICRAKLLIDEPTFTDFNHVISQAVSSVTSPLRLGDSNDVNLTSKFFNLSPYARLKYCMSSYSPLTRDVGSSGVRAKSTRDMITECFSADFQMITSENFRDARYMGVNMTFRGNFGEGEQIINDGLRHITRSNIVQFVEWCPTGFNVGSIKQPPAFHRESKITRSGQAVTSLSNNTGISDTFRRLYKKVSRLYSRRAYVWWLVDEGLEEGDIRDGLDNLKYLRQDYKDLLVEDDSDDIGDYSDDY